MKKIGKITVKCEPDYDNDLSHIGEYTDEQIQAIEREDIGFISIGAEAEILTSDDGKTWLVNHIHSGSLYGIGTDSEESYLQEIAKEQLSDLKDVLLTLGFSQGMIAAAPVVYPQDLIFNLEPKP